VGPRSSCVLRRAERAPPRRGSRADDFLERANELWRRERELGLVVRRELREEALASRRDPERDLATVATARHANDEPALDAAIDEAHRAVVPDLEALADGANGRHLTARQAFDREEELVLARLDARVARGSLAEG